ncbi:hypothetical protein M2651_01120 [Clostridium sp. SYSU_GA19001]|uniref:hypothetical protein n=1 Tax=Clostridium caldaquaticum TaxID=2940653 RepID=UPI002077285F|nr:hypothetical protein [Clostridium caldaquaticum]MCM8709620.1 hypothetical protein [Clostridium caldaquaticum]
MPNYYNGRYYDYSYDTENQYYGRSNYYGNNLNNYLLGVGLAPLLGINPILGLGLGFLLGNRRDNTNIININTRRNWDDIC